MTYIAEVLASPTFIRKLSSFVETEAFKQIWFEDGSTNDYGCLDSLDLPEGDRNWHTLPDAVKKDAEAILNENLAHFLETLSVTQKGPNLVLWRAMGVADPEKFVADNQKNKVGIYWSYRQENAQAYWNNKGIEVVLEAEFEADAVDMETTALLHLNKKAEDEETEIRIKSGAKGTLLAVTLEDEPIFEGRTAIVAKAELK